MSYKTAAVAAAFVLAALIIGAFPPGGYSDAASAAQLPPDEYGNILINRTSEKHGVKSATFSHWQHRRRHTCRVCHFELEFNMKTNTTEITEEANRSGRYCGTSGCHDGKAAFGHTEANCQKCHNGDRGYAKEDFTRFASMKKTGHGNRVNWNWAIRKRSIMPLNYLTMKPSEDITVDTKLRLDAQMQRIPPAVFLHKDHTRWLDCNNCHPDIFGIKKKSTKELSMHNINKGEFCGVCHISVAFPLEDCNRCHPGMGTK